jgi:hypothetical protein
MEIKCGYCKRNCHRHNDKSRKANYRIYFYFKILNFQYIIIFLAKIHFMQLIKL